MTDGHPSGKRICERCGERNVFPAQRKTICKACQAIRAAEKIRKREQRQKADKELSDLRAFKEQRELEDAQKVDDVEVAIATQMEKGGPLGKMLEDAYNVWKLGQFPGSSELISDAVRRDMFKLVLQHVGEEGGEKDMRVNLVLDAHLVCPECQKKFLPDDRVSDEEIDGMFGKGPSYQETELDGYVVRPKREEPK